MDSIEYNNREQLKAVGNLPASDMTIRDRIAMEAMSSLIATGCLSEKEESMERVADLAVKLADKLIKKLCENDKF
jgi:hypothetical protein